MRLPLFMLLMASPWLLACQASPHSHFEATAAAEGREPVLPAGVGVMMKPPACAYEELGKAFVATGSHIVTDEKIERLREQAALYGADAIIVHPTLPDCEQGYRFEICEGRGEYVEATAIAYRRTQEDYSGLEYSVDTGYDTIEYVDPTKETMPLLPLPLDAETASQPN